MVVACPHHGYDKIHLVKFFHSALLAKLKQTISTMCARNLFRRTANDIWEFFEDFADKARTWVDHSTMEGPSKERKDAKKVNFVTLEDMWESRCKHLEQDIKEKM